MAMVPSLYSPSFDARGDLSSTGQRWTEYTDCFDKFLTAMEIDDPIRQRTLLLHFSEEICCIFKTVPDTGEGNNYRTAITKLTTYFQPKKLHLNVILFAKPINKVKH